MADGWRTRYVAPVYALVISFVVVLLLGMAFATDDGTNKAAPATPTIGFVPAGFPARSAVLVSGGRQVPIKDQKALESLKPAAPFQICAVLDPGWTTSNGVKLPKSDFTCWGPFDPDARGDVELKVRKVS